MERKNFLMLDKSVKTSNNDFIEAHSSLLLLLGSSRHSCFGRDMDRQSA